MQIDIGISDTDRAKIAESLERLLADTYTLYLKTHGYHWNVTGPMFRSLHLMFEEHYLELRDAVDVIAERILSLGHPAPATFAAFAKLSSIEEDDSVPPAMEMVRRLAAGHEQVAKTAREVTSLAESAGDVATADLGTTRVDVHEKTAWMLRATATE
jgi:starvation-inducible DNA-binding protein